ncbi:MAG: hypothetical protein MPJ50_07195 [Pirellulales bacterium]|nr:hypothetical protein [Pirellulales bacterium]
MLIPILIMIAVALDTVILVGLMLLTRAHEDQVRLRSALVLAITLAMFNTSVFASTRYWWGEWGVPVAFVVLPVFDGLALKVVGKLTRRQVFLTIGVLICYWIVREFAALALLAD